MSNRIADMDDEQLDDLEIMLDTILDIVDEGDLVELLLERMYPDEQVQIIVGTIDELLKEEKPPGSLLQ